MKGKTQKPVTPNSTPKPQREPPRECPAIVEEAITLIRQVPADRKWPSLEELADLTDGNQERAPDVLLEYLPELPISKWAKNVDWQKPHYAVLTVYRSLFVIRKMLLSAAEKAKLLEAIPSLGFTMGVIDQWPEFSVRFVIDPQTQKFQIHSSDKAIFDALEDLDARDLRICPVCKKLFWSQRKNVTRCSERCSSNLRQKRKRAEMKRQDEEFKASQEAAGMKVGKGRK